MPAAAEKTPPTPREIREQLADPKTVRLLIELRDAKERIRQLEAFQAQCSEFNRKNAILQGKLQAAEVRCKQVSAECQSLEENARGSRNTLRLAENGQSRQAQRAFDMLLEIARARDAEMGTIHAQQIEESATSQKRGVANTLDKLIQALQVLQESEKRLVDAFTRRNDEKSARNRPSSQKNRNAERASQDFAQQKDFDLAAAAQALLDCVSKYYCYIRKPAPETNDIGSWKDFERLIKRVTLMFGKLLSERQAPADAQSSHSDGTLLEQQYQMRISMLEDMISDQAEQIEQFCAAINTRESDTKQVVTSD